MTDDTTPTTLDITNGQGQPRLTADGDGQTNGFRWVLLRCLKVIRPGRSAAPFYRCIEA